MGHVPFVRLSKIIYPDSAVTAIIKYSSDLTNFEYNENHHIHDNRTPAFYLFFRVLDWHIIQFFFDFTSKKDGFLAKKWRFNQNGLLIESGVLLPRIRYLQKVFTLADLK